MRTFNRYPVYLSEDQFVDFWKDYYEEHEWTLKDRVHLYVHYPWCRNVCKFCVFGALKYGDVHSNIITSYESATVRMIEKMNPIITKKIPDEIYFGGGTPSLWSQEQMFHIPEALSDYDIIPQRAMEIHPFDLSDKLIDFVSNLMNLNLVSIGVQSFDKESNLQQNRIPPDPDKIYTSIRKFQQNGVRVNIDLVAMFNGDDESNWDIFKKDLDLTLSMFKPDSITISPNYKSNDYYGISIKFREILQEYFSKHPEYNSIYGDIVYSLSYDDILKFADIPYKFHSNDYDASLDETTRKSIGSLGETIAAKTMIGFGGIYKMPAISQTPDGWNILGRYEPMEDEFIFELRKCEPHGTHCDSQDPYHRTFYVGHYQMPLPKQRN